MTHPQRRLKPAGQQAELWADGSFGRNRGRGGPPLSGGLHPEKNAYAGDFFPLSE
jgi:hypothetical protein